MFKVLKYIRILEKEEEKPQFIPKTGYLPWQTGSDVSTRKGGNDLRFKSPYFKTLRKVETV